MPRTAGHLDTLPKPLLDDLVAGKWIPIIGAGFSRNAVVPVGDPPPVWATLARQLAKDIPHFTYDNPLDAISAYEHEFTRSRLVERIIDLLRINDAQPGEAHRAFCKVTFETVVTTNFDLLLERQYAGLQRPCLPIIDEVQLSLPNPYEGPTLVKLHGDVHHPERLVLTEADYDIFLAKYPLLATYLSSLLIANTAVLVGYSLEDPDLRQLLAIIRERLGTMKRPVYAVLVSPEPGITARFERRGVKVVALAGSRSNYGSILARLFTELQEYSVNQVPAVSQTTEESVSESLLLPPQAGRLCYFAVPLRLLSWYRENFFPVAREQGLTPVSGNEVISPGGATLTKIDALMQRSFAVVVDVASRNTLFELGLARSRLARDRLLVISEERQLSLTDPEDITILRRSGDPFEESDALTDAFRSWLTRLTEAVPSETMIEPERLLLAGENRAAVASAFSLLEEALLRRLGAEQPPSQRSFPRLLDAAFRAGLFEADSATVKQLKNDYRVRSRVVHTSEPVNKATATEIIQRTMAVLRSLESTLE